MSEEKEIKVAETAVETETQPEVSSEMAKIVHDPNAPVITVKELLGVGAHYGHLKRRWNPNFAQFIFTSRNNIHIINLDKTAALIAEDYAQLKDIVSKGGKVLFVGTKDVAKDAVIEEAVRSGSFYVNHRWLGGTLTNFKTISKSIKRLKDLEKLEIDGVYNTMSKKDAIKSKKEQAKLALNLEGIKEMRKLPDAMIVVDPATEHNAVAEAKLLNIPVFALLNTNSEPEGISNPIPCNDSSAKTIKLVLGVLADAIVEGKGGDVAYAYASQEGDNADFAQALKAVDKTEETKQLRSLVKADLYAIRKAKKPLGKGIRQRKQSSKNRRPAKKAAPKAAPATEAKPAEQAKTAEAAAPANSEKGTN